MGKTKIKQSSREKKEIEEQVPTRDCKEALMKIGSPGLSRCREKLAGSSHLLGILIPWRFINFIKKSLFLNNWRAIWDFILILSENVSFNNDLSFGPPKNWGAKLALERLQQP